MEPSFIKGMGVQPLGVVAGFDFKGSLSGFPGKRLDNSSNSGVNKGPENLIQGFLTAGNTLTTEIFLNTFMDIVGIPAGIDDIRFRTGSQIHQVPASETGPVKIGFADDVAGFTLM
jgi:hypothetical protein